MKKIIVAIILYFFLNVNSFGHLQHYSGVKYLEYDYIGAWWNIKDTEDSWNGLRPGSTYGKVGNGGFSLRSRRLLKFVQENFKFRRVFDYDARKPYYDHFNRKVDGELGYVPGIRPDDQTMARLNGSFLHDNGFKFAPIELSQKFSVEATDATYQDFLNGNSKLRLVSYPF